MAEPPKPRDTGISKAAATAVVEAAKKVLEWQWKLFYESVYPPELETYQNWLSSSFQGLFHAVNAVEPKWKPGLED